MQQHTLKEKQEIKGIGLHSGLDVTLSINPAPINHGIVFKRVDIKDSLPLKATYNNVVDK